MHPDIFRWKLEPFELYTSPESVAAYYNNRIDQMSRDFHRLYRTRLARGEWRDRLIPILLNTNIILGIYRNPNLHTGNNIGNKTLHFISKTQRINYWCCINRGFMEVHAQLAKNLTGEENCRSDANISVNAYTGVAKIVRINPRLRSSP